MKGERLSAEPLVYFSVNLNKILCFIFIKKNKKNSTKCLLQSRLVLANNVQKIIYTVNLRYQNEKWKIGSPLLKATIAGKV